ncbi:hypothetical protein [Ammoniphilus sp. YIM 78166]|uniref:hypothetical protein n=1 Tax=Ammoniphilus sp. YIM 78166 TaxID=1644106 RepID=UPI00106FBAF8|nr:hypothetical protein [Ammoniphilus sp. YIM 78166]
MTGLIAEYKTYREENQQLKEAIHNFQQQVQEKSTQLVQRDQDIAAVEEKVKQLQAKHADELDRLAERKDMEKERELLQVRTEYQEKLQKVNEESTSKIQSFYERMEQIRKEYEHQIEELKKKK